MRLPIEQVARRGRVGSRGNRVQKACQARLNQMDTGRFERLHETGRKPQRDAIVRPYRSRGPVRETQRQRIASAAPSRWQAESPPPRRRDELAAINIACARAMRSGMRLNANGGARDRLGVRPKCLARFARHRQCRSHGQMLDQSMKRCRALHRAKLSETPCNR